MANGATPYEVFDYGIKGLCRELKRIGRKVTIISSIPEQGESISVKLRKAEIWNTDLSDVFVARDEYELRQQKVKQTLKSLEKEELARIIWVDDFFYPQGAKQPLFENGKILYSDDDHLSPTGAKLLIKRLAPQFKFMEYPEANHS